MWNGWKAQLLRTLYYETEPVLTGGFSEVDRARRVAMAQSEFRASITDWPADELESYIAKLYPAWLAKAERKHRSKAELDEVLRWLTGHSEQSLAAEIAGDASVEQFFARAPRLNPARELVTGTVCGVRVEKVEDPRMRVLRQVDKMVDELAKGWAMERVLRG